MIYKLQHSSAGVLHCQCAAQVNIWYTSCKRARKKRTNERNKYSNMGNSQQNSNRQCGHITARKKRLNGFNYISPYIQPLTISTNANKAATKLQISECTDNGAGEKERMRMETNTFFSLQKKSLHARSQNAECW